MKIEHITINTANLEESVAFYKEILDLEIRRDFRGMGGPSIVFLSDKEGDTSIELIENKEQAYSGSGLSIGFHVDNVDEMHKIMDEKGLNPSPMISPNPHVKFFFIEDPNGVKIQLI